MWGNKITNKDFLLLCLVSTHLLFSYAAICGDGVVQGTEQCDDGNTISHDGCSSTCMIEGIAVQTWYTNSSCAGGIVKALVLNNREWRTPTSPTDWRQPGLCSSGIECKCPDGYPSCADGSLPDRCICQQVTCALIVKTFTMDCLPYPANSSSNAAFFHMTLCHSSFPNFSFTDQRSVSGSFLISKGWRLTSSSSYTGSVKADISAWELTRARAIASSLPDVWHVWAARTCLPSQNNLMPEGPASSAFFEYHDTIRQRARMQCTDMTCTNCDLNVYVAQYACNHSLTCQVLSPGSCKVCTGGVADTKLEGFAIWPGPPAPLPYKCAPCSQAPSNYFYKDTECRAGQGCGACGLDLPTWPVVFWPGMACGACGQQDAPATA
mmetsp:Transcript_29241/g.93951  ORF Transcript_29241/g.93951 Transcript_29241/m.93951 type:complete len:380 (+) Transcript_29241:388-1527(+)